MTINKKEQELIEEVLEHFDFNKCHEVMEHLDWRWGLNPEVPTIDRIKESGRDRIMGAIKGIKENKKHHYLEGYFSSSGGLKATVYKNKYGLVTNIILEFVLSDWHAGED